VANHANFWVAVTTIGPIAIATNLLSLGPVVVAKDVLPRKAGETSFTSWLRSLHLVWVATDLVVCLLLIELALQSLWSGSDAAPEWVAIGLLQLMLVVLCILAICSASILDPDTRANAQVSRRQLVAARRVAGRR
jgi:hypothetical protein